MQGKPVQLELRPTASVLIRSSVNTTSLNENFNTRSLIRKGLSYAFGDGSSTLVNLIVFTLLLRYLSPPEFGYHSVGQALSSWVQPVLYMGANLVAVRLIAAS